MAQSPAPNRSPRALPSLSNIRTYTQQFFGVRPCLWQLKVAETILLDAPSLMKAGMQAILISGETASQTRVQAISTFKYRVIMISPEQVMKPDGGFEKLLKNHGLGGIPAGVQRTWTTSLRAPT